MAKVKTIARRTFLFGSAAIGGGVAFGIYKVKTPHENPLEATLAPGEATFNPWVKISEDGITLIAPHTDIGQGARSIQAALIAEELDLNWGDFTVEAGTPAPAYFNTAAKDEGAPFRARDTGIVASSVRSLVGAGAKLLGLVMTGGSSMVPDSYEKLRVAGAVARETLKHAAAKRAGVSVSNITTANGAVILPDGARIAYTELASAAAETEPVEEVELRDPSTWRLLGKDMLRLDTRAKSTGTQTYGIDLKMDGMLNASVRINPRKGGSLNGFDASAAKTMPGVSHVLEVTNGIAVVADNTWNAFQALDAIDYQWGPAPFPASSAEHWSEIEASFTDERLDREWRNDGDVASVEGQRMELEYRAPHLAHAPLEPIGAVVLVTDTRADIWVAHQFPRFAMDLVAKVTGLDVDDVYLHNQFAGGSFGHRFEFENVRYATEVAAQLKGTPIKLTFKREDDFAQEYPRHNGICRIEGSVRNKQIESLDVAIAAPAVLTTQLERAGLPVAGPDLQLPAGIWDAPYAIPNLRVRAYRVPKLVPTSSWRSVGASTGGFFLESAIDELCHAAGADPLTERLRICDDPIAARVLEAVGEMSNWGESLSSGRGRGLAMVFSFGVYVAEVVDVTDTDQGIRIDKVWVATDVGPVLDPVNFENQVQGGVIWGLGHAMNCELTYKDGMTEQRNYHQHTGMRLYQCPDIEIRHLNNATSIKGIGEPPVPPAAPALANAIFAATGTRLRQMPFDRFVRFA